ncbi:TetR/AcrR family transcriptional regulator [Streptomyces sp. NPDC050560]|uniref:TetR/AcrR family transcriptional regulator n=1 Tax=Streptomyces sp. NPDC050560 TaxID=3365630 RepID=UPI0037B87F7E
MGHREDLLEGAKRCLLDKGFARTTARDIVRESGTNLASIGYHYGSKDALLAKACISLVEEIGASFAPGETVTSEHAPGSAERFQEMWDRVLHSFTDERMRAIWMLSLAVTTEIDRMPEVRRLLGEAQRDARSGLVPMFSGVAEGDLDEETVETEGRLYITLLNGLMVQWLFDENSATTAEQLTAGMRRIAGAMTGQT